MEPEEQEGKQEETLLNETNSGEHNTESESTPKETVATKEEAHHATGTAPKEETVEAVDLREEDKEDSIPIIEDIMDDDEDLAISPIMKTVMFLIVVGLVAGGAYWMFGGEDTVAEGQQKLDSSIQIIDENTYTYGNYEFVRDSQGLWKVELFDPRRDAVYVIRLHHGPKDIMDVPIVGDVNKFKNYTFNYLGTQKQSGATFVSVDPLTNNENYSLAFVEFVRNLEVGVGIKPFGSYTDVVEGSPRPVKRCTNTDEPVVYLRHEDPTFVLVEEDGCLVIQGTGDDLLKAVDKVLLTFYGVLR